MSWVDVRLGPFDAADQTPPPVSHVPLAALAAAPLGPWLMGLIAGLGKAPCGRGQASRRSRALCGPSALPPREGDRPLLMGRFERAATLGHRERPGETGPPQDPRGRQCPRALRRPVWVQASPSSRGPPPVVSQPFAGSLVGRLGLPGFSGQTALRGLASHLAAHGCQFPQCSPGRSRGSPRPASRHCLWLSGIGEGTLRKDSVPRPPEEPGSSLEAGRVVGDSLGARHQGCLLRCGASAQQDQPGAAALALRGPGLGGACWAGRPGTPSHQPGRRGRASAGAGPHCVLSGGRRLRRLHHARPADELPPVCRGEAQGAAPEAARHLL